MRRVFWKEGVKLNMLAVSEKERVKKGGIVSEENWTEWMFGRRKDISLPHKWPYRLGGADVTELLTANMYDSLKMDQSHLLRKWVLLFFSEKNPTSDGCSAWLSYCILISDYLFLLDLKLFLFLSFYNALLHTLGGEVISNGLIKDYSLNQFWGQELIEKP